MFMRVQNNWWITENFMAGLAKEKFENAQWSHL
jgi:hypothetical protein